MSDLFSPSSLSNTGMQLVSQTEEEQFLRFSLDSSTRIMLPIRQITEVLKIQFSQIVPIPQMPDWVMGVYNWRGDILWMVDLAHLIGLSPWYQQNTNRSSHTAIVLSPDKDRANRGTKIDLGLVVSRVEDIELCDTSAIQSPPESSIHPQLAPFLQGYWLGSHEDMILVLDGKAIVAAMPSLAN